MYIMGGSVALSSDQESIVTVRGQQLQPPNDLGSGTQYGGTSSPTNQIHASWVQRPWEGTSRLCLFLQYYNFHCSSFLGIHMHMVKRAITVKYGLYQRSWMHLSATCRVSLMMTNNGPASCHVTSTPSHPRPSNGRAQQRLTASGDVQNASFVKEFQRCRVGRKVTLNISSARCKRKPGKVKKN